MTGPTCRDSYSQNAAENYERYFVPSIGRPVAVDLVEDAALHPDERVLDVACGTGIVARLAAARVGPRGAVEGLDPNSGMLAIARDVARSGPSIVWHEAPAEAIALDVSAPVITLALLQRLRSRDESSFGDRLLAALRQQFGGHAIKGGAES